VRQYKKFNRTKDVRIKRSSYGVKDTMKRNGKLTVAKRNLTRVANGKPTGGPLQDEMQLMRKWWANNMDGGHDDCVLAAKAAGHGGDISKSYNAKSWAKQQPAATIAMLLDKTNGKPVSKAKLTLSVEGPVDAATLDAMEAQLGDKETLTYDGHLEAAQQLLTAARAAKKRPDPLQSMILAQQAQNHMVQAEKRLTDALANA